VQYEDLTRAASELVRLGPDVILASASANAMAAKQATSTIPIVVPALGDPVGLGLIAVAPAAWRGLRPGGPFKNCVAFFPLGGPDAKSIRECHIQVQTCFQARSERAGASKNAQFFAMTRSVMTRRPPCGAWWQAARRSQRSVGLRCLDGRGRQVRWPCGSAAWCSRAAGSADEIWHGSATLNGNMTSDWEADRRLPAS
jgi:hypothetical protein